LSSCAMAALRESSQAAATIPESSRNLRRVSFDNLFIKPTKAVVQFPSDLEKLPPV